MRIITKPRRFSPAISEALKKIRERPRPELKDSARYSRERKLSVRQATPAWADLAAIKNIYAEARWKSLRTRIKHHVDHIVPIKGVTVCGLHVESNLRVLPGRLNVGRPRRFMPE